MKRMWTGRLKLELWLQARKSLDDDDDDDEALTKNPEFHKFVIDSFKSIQNVLSKNVKDGSSDDVDIFDDDITGMVDCSDSFFG